MKNERNTESFLKKDISGIFKLIMATIFLLLFILSACIRKPYKAEGFAMSDASYHVLLTMQAYDETPSAVHKWLPIQTLGEECNKYINNGPSLIQDMYGNSYYVSFSPLGFYLPYFFCKLFHLSFSLDSLYVFNCALMFISAILIGYIIYMILKEPIVFFISSVAYIFIPEVLFSQGIVYWHHSLAQVVFLLQTVFFIKIFVNREFRFYYVLLFGVLSFLFPYLEWTGYISNIGMVLAILILDLKLEGKNTTERRLSISVSSIVTIVVLAIVTIGAFGYYVFRFSCIAPVNEVLSMMFSRAKARQDASIMSLLKGYIDSFLPLMILGLVCLILSLCIKEARLQIKKVLTERKIWVTALIFVFPLIENLVMRGHAIAYTFDRLKGSFILVFILSIEIYVLWQSIHKKILTFLVIVFGIYAVMGLIIYDDGRTMLLDEYEDTISLRNYLEKEYFENGKGIIVKNGWRAWGFLQTTYHRNIYCTSLYSKEQLKEIASNSGNDYIIFLERTSNMGDTACYTQATVEEVSTSKCYQLNVKDGLVDIKELSDYQTEKE